MWFVEASAEEGGKEREGADWRVITGIAFLAQESIMHGCASIFTLHHTSPQYHSTNLHPTAILDFHQHLVLLCHAPRITTLIMLVCKFHKVPSLHTESIKASFVFGCVLLQVFKSYH